MLFLTPLYTAQSVQNKKYAFCVLPALTALRMVVIEINIQGGSICEIVFSNYQVLIIVCGSTELQSRLATVTAHEVGIRW